MCRHRQQLQNPCRVVVYYYYFLLHILLVYSVSRATFLRPLQNKVIKNKLSRHPICVQYVRYYIHFIFYFCFFLFFAVATSLDESVGI
jgi:hypothetical protein